MSFDPHTEDFQRLGLRYARTLDDADPFGAARAFASFGRRFSQNRDALPQSDGDRAFHLVARATDLIDYQLPFAPDEACEGIIGDARRLLGEAIDLDGSCHDAVRMLAAADNPSFEGYYRFLADGEDRVRESCERRRASIDLPRGDVSDLAGDIAMRPYLRWLATEASRALICGRYRRCVEIAHRLLELDETDPADVRLTLALAYAKLEDRASLDRLWRARLGTRRRASAWFSLAAVALAFKRGETRRAESLTRKILASYPHAGTTLARQDELPDGVFARLTVEPNSEDELILAVSEAAVLLQEGRDPSERGSLGSWLASRPEVVAACAADGLGKGAGAAQ